MPYPDFPSALSVLTGRRHPLRSASFFGTDDIAFSATVTVGSLPLPAPLDPLAPKTITRSYTSLSQAASEAQISRVYAGIHYREACTAGGLHGTKIGRFAVRTELRPVRGKK